MPLSVCSNVDVWKEEISKYYPSLLNKDDDLRKFLDMENKEPAKKLLSIKRIQEYQRAIDPFSALNYSAEISDIIDRALASVRLTLDEGSTSKFELGH